MDCLNNISAKYGEYFSKFTVLPVHFQYQLFVLMQIKKDNTISVQITLIVNHLTYVNKDQIIPWINGLTVYIFLCICKVGLIVSVSVAPFCLFSLSLLSLEGRSSCSTSMFSGTGRDVCSVTITWETVVHLFVDIFSHVWK